MWNLKQNIFCEPSKGIQFFFLNAFTIRQDNPTITNEITDVNIRPTLCATIAKKFVLIKYPIESGMKTVPICHFCKM